MLSSSASPAGYLDCIGPSRENWTCGNGQNGSVRGRDGRWPCRSSSRSRRRFNIQHGGREIRARHDLSSIDRSFVTEAIARNLDVVFERQPCRILGLYWPIKGELDLRQWAERISARKGWTLALPIIEQEQTPLQYSAWRPGDPSSARLVLDRSLVCDGSNRTQPGCCLRAPALPDTWTVLAHQGRIGPAAMGRTDQCAEGMDAGPADHRAGADAASIFSMAAGRSELGTTCPRSIARL